MDNKPHILFVCGRHQWRSPTAEAIYRKDPRIMARSAGVSEKSRHQVSAKDLDWADLMLVMERKYKAKILEMLPERPNPPRIVSLDIPDDYERMDPELIVLIQNGTEFHLKQEFGIEPRDVPDKSVAASSKFGGPQGHPSERKS
jgi:predicted protein tyrosine phosphatase